MKVQGGACPASSCTPQLIVQCPDFVPVCRREVSILDLAFRQSLPRGGQLLRQLPPLAFQGPQPPDVRPVRGAGQVGEHVHLPERVDHQGPGGARVGHEGPVRAGHVALRHRPIPEVDELGFRFCSTESPHRAPVLPIENLLHQLRHVPRLRCELDEMAVDSVLGPVRLETQSRPGGDLAQLGKAETRAAD